MPNIAKCIIFVGSTILVTLGGFMIALWPAIHDLVLHSELSLSPKSVAFNVWKDTPIPIYQKFYMFNWTNSESISNHSIKPTFTEHGPYVFREHHKRVNISWKDANETVEFHQIRTYFFEPEMSNGSLDDIIVNVNPIALSAAYTVRFHPWLLRGVDLMFRAAKIQLPIAKTVKELLFVGYKDPLLDLLNLMNNSQFNIPFDKFGWFYDRNNSWSYDGKFDMYTGRDNLGKLGVLTEWNDRNHTKYNYGACSMVNGTTGELWPPVNGTADLDLFATDLCRSIKLEYLRKTVKHGVEGNLYIAAEKTLDNGQKLPENKCFCGSPSDESCVPAGAMNVSKCKFGAPAFLSLPHFYRADPYYIKNIDMPPANPLDDDLFIALEPETGLPLEVEAKLQINLLLQPFPEIKLFKNVPKLMFPMFHFNQVAELTPHLATILKIVLSLKLVGNIIFSILIVIGLSIFSSGIYMTIWGRWAKVPAATDRAQLIDEEDGADSTQGDGN